MVKKDQFKGKPVISLMKDEEDTYPFTFGVAKAKLILENISEIRNFVAENDASIKPEDSVKG
jgi:hypothetical protein